MGLIKALTGDTKTFIRQEIELAKTELSEKISAFGKNATSLAIGGFVAYAGLIVFLIALGCLIAWALEKADLAPLLAGFIGFAGIGLLVIGIGCAVLFKGLAAIKSNGIAPQRTIQTLQDLKGGADVYAVGHEHQEDVEEEQKSVSSEVMQERVEDTENRLGETLHELGRRLSPAHINSQVKRKIQTNPYRSGLIAAVAGVLSGVILRRKMSHT